MSLRDQARGIRPNDWASVKDLMCDLAQTMDSLIIRGPANHASPDAAGRQLLDALQASLQELTNRVTEIEETI